MLRQVTLSTTTIPEYGRSPYRNSSAISTPKDHTSDLIAYFRCFTTSGAVHSIAICASAYKKTDTYATCKKVIASYTQWIFFTDELYMRFQKKKHRETVSSELSKPSRVKVAKVTLICTATSSNCSCSGAVVTDRESVKLHELLLIYRPRRDGRLSWPGWLTHSGLRTLYQQSGHMSTVDQESPPKF